MAKDYGEMAIDEVRRKDRAVDDERWIVELLRRAAVGALATVYEGQPFINENIFVYDEGERVIYLHTARVGRTRANVEGGGRALQMLLDKYFGHLRPGRDYRAITDGELERTAVYRLDIERCSGKMKEEEVDFAGAFLYRQGES